MAGRWLARAGHRIWSLFRRLYVDPLREAVIDLSGLPISFKILAFFGYFSVFLLLFLALLFELMADRLTLIEYTMTSGTKQVPFVVLVTSSIGLVWGWGFILAGSTDCRWWVFLPVVGVLLLQLFLMMPYEGDGMFVWCCTVPGAILLLVGTYIFSHSRHYWRDFPLLEVLIWWAVLAFFLVLMWLLQPTDMLVAEALDASFSVLLLLAIPFWLFSGLTLADFVLTVASRATATLRALLPGEPLRALVAAVMLVRPVVAFAVAGVDPRTGVLGMALALDVFLSLPLLLVMVLVMVLRRWTTRNAMTLLAASIASPIFALGLVLGLDNLDISDVMGATLESVGTFAPLLVFVLLMTHSVLSMGSQFASGDSRALPRRARILLVFGAALLVTSFALFFVNIRDPLSGALDQSLQDIVNGALLFSMLLVGFPYLIWVLLRRREKVIGEETDVDCLERALTQAGRRPMKSVWLLVSLLLGLVLSCVLFLGALLLGAVLKDL